MKSAPLMRLLFFIFFPLAVMAGNGDDWYFWEGSELPQRDWSVNDLYKWNLVRFFGESPDIEYSAKKSSLSKKSKNGLMGVEIDWGHALEPGYIYKFVIPVNEPPDYVLVDGSKEVWNKGNGFSDGKNIEFTFIPLSTNHIKRNKLYLVIDSDSAYTFPTLERWGIHKAGFKCFRRHLRENDNAFYPDRKLPETLRFIENDSTGSLSYLPQYGQVPVDYKRSPLDPSAISDNLVFFENSQPVKDHVGNDGVNGLILSKGLKMPDSRRQFDIGLFMPMLNSEKINNLCIFGPFYGKYILDENKISGQVACLKKTADLFLSQNPSNALYVMVPEADGQNFGKWEKDYNVSNSLFLDRVDGNLAEKPLADIYRLASAKQRIAYDDLKKTVGHPGRFKVIFMGHDALFELQCFYDAGADIIIHKHIGRQNLNLVTANARGAAYVYGKEYGFDADCWYGWNVYNFAPQELEDNLMVYFMSGGRYFMAEAPTAVPGTENALNKAPTVLGTVWLDFVRRARQHPSLGVQQSRIAIMRSYGKTNKGGTYGGMDKEHRNILDIVFPHHQDSRTTRLSTGTPYGPVDIIPHTISASAMKKYAVVIFLGGKGFDMNETVYQNLKTFVENGGILIMPVEQMRKANGDFLKNDMNGFADITLPDEKTVPAGCKNIIEHKSGKGYVFTVMGKYLSPFADVLIREKLEETKWLSFTPASDWLEYMVQKKGNIWILPVFNHGNVGFPSGNGRKTGAWNGKISLDLSKFEFPKGTLAVYESIYVPDEKIPFKLIKIDSVQENGRLSFDIKIDKFSEIVIGPSETTESEYLKK